MQSYHLCPCIACAHEMQIHSQTQMPFNDQLWDKVNGLSGSKIINDLLWASTFCPINRCVVGKFNNGQLKINLPFEFCMLCEIHSVMWQVEKTCSSNQISSVLDVTHLRQFVREIFREDITKLFNHVSDFKRNSVVRFLNFSYYVSHKWSTSFLFLAKGLHGLGQGSKLGLYDSERHDKLEIHRGSVGFTRLS